MQKIRSGCAYAAFSNCMGLACCVSSQGGELANIEVPAATKSACVQLEYADGTLSEKKTFRKP